MKIWAYAPRQPSAVSIHSMRCAGKGAYSLAEVTILHVGYALSRITQRPDV